MAFVLERLAARPSSATARIEALDESAAIRAQIQRLFAGRTSSGHGASSVIEWGLPCVVEIGANDTLGLARYAEQARRAILRHEPRLKDVVVTVAPQDNVLTPFCLRISAVLVGSGEACRFDVKFSHHGT